MNLHRNLLLKGLALACILPTTVIVADVVVDMPAPPRASEPAEDEETAPDAGGAAIAATQAGPAAAARPSVGQVALARYARGRSRPRNTYYVSSYSRYGGYYWPYSHHYLGPYHLGGWNYFWPGWTWGSWNVSFNCSQSSSGSSSSGSSGASSSSAGSSSPGAGN